MKLALEGKLALISGASGGIGRALCEGFLNEGARVAASFRNSEEKLNPLREWMIGKDIPPDRLIPVALDLEQTQGFESAIESLEANHGPVHVLINNAGYAFEFPFVGTDEGEISRILDINLKGTLLLTQNVLKRMIRQRQGAIVTVTSAVSQTHGRGVAVYAAAKAALNRWTEVVAIETAKKGVRVNAVAPGAVNTKMSANLMKMAGDHVIESTPQGRIAEPEEIVPAVLFLASNAAASFITGQTFFVDGGLSL